ncbi:hypothetical protein F5884DRAFT_774552 [Xylogone sp. PMI_703]|nr:hypothetical protein F5884DRAFT_774552 [Xylogone sp. PMI_703]
MSPTSTIIITGGNGSLGSKIALKLTKDFPGFYHLVLTARNTESEIIRQISAELRAQNSSFSWESCDLASFKSVNAFTDIIKKTVSDGSIPKLHGLINSAAVSSNATKNITADGFDVTYQTNVLSPILLISNLVDCLPVGSVVVNVASAAHNLGRVDYFENLNESAGGKLSLTESLTKYGSSKLLLIMSGYIIQRKLLGRVKLVASDPGGMSGGSRLSTDPHWFLRALRIVLIGLRPIVRLASKSAINPPEVPAQAISKFFLDNADTAGKYFILDDESKSSGLSLDPAKQDEVWMLILKDFKRKSISLKL